MPLSFMLQQSGAASIINSAPGIVARFDATTGITSAGGFASQWSDLSGNARHLLQATGANQPIHLDYSGTKYGWLPGVAGNYFSTPDSVAASITGDIDIRVKAALVDWTPTAYSVLIDKWTVAGGLSYQFYVAITSGKLVLSVSPDGTTTTGYSAFSTVAPTVTNGGVLWCRVTRVAATGKVNFYTSSNGVTWTLLGAADVSTTASAIADTAAPVEIGIQNGSASPLNGRVYQAQIYNTIGGTTPVVDFDPSRWSSGTTFTASTGEVWTINSTGSKPAQIVDRPSLLFDGAAHKMATAAFTLNQPSTHYYVMRHITWTSGDVLSDGLSANTGALAQTTGTPKISINAGAAAAENSDLALGTWKVVCVVINGASSSIQVGTAAATTGNAGAGNMGGLMLGADGGGLNYGNAQFSQDLHYNVVHAAATRANIIAALNSKWGLS